MKEFFPNSLWYGFTGTPIFMENAKKAIGDLPRTTEQQYGKRLHEYTVKEAIHDKAVLGFQIEYKTTFSDQELDQIILKLDSENKLEIEKMEVKEKEAWLPKSVYEDERHMLEVIRSIVNESQNKLGFKKGAGQTYQAILTAPSIVMAQRYYELIKKVKSGETPIVIDERTKKILPDFPKVAITYSISENEEASINNQDKMKESLRDYNEMFGTSYTLETIRAYNSNINDRLARKKEKYLARSEQLDLVIVGDRLLTGFDAPSLSTLFIDRMPMKPQDLIQAFSRTNRLFDNDKQYGQIVTFRVPQTFEAKVKEALILYSNGGENDVLAPSWQEAKEDFIGAIDALKEIVPEPNAVDELNIADLKKFAKAFQSLDKTFASVQVYTDYDSSLLGTEFPIVFEEVEKYYGKYVNALEEIKRDRESKDDEEDLDIDIAYELESVKTEEINYEYILMLIQAFVPDKDDEYELIPLQDEKAKSEVEKYLQELMRSNPKLGQLMKELWQQILEDPEGFRNKNVSYVLEQMVNQTTNKMLSSFAHRWRLDSNELEFMAENYNPSREKQNGELELKRTSNYEEYKSFEEKPVISIGRPLWGLFMT